MWAGNDFGTWFSINRLAHSQLHIIIRPSLIVTMATREKKEIVTMSRHLVGGTGWRLDITPNAEDEPYITQFGKHAIPV